MGQFLGNCWRIKDEWLIGQCCDKVSFYLHKFDASTNVAHEIP